MNNCKYTDDELSLETIMGLGAYYDINGVRIPQITTAKIPLLIAISSPFFQEQEDKDNSQMDFDAKAIFDALFILHKGVEAVQPVFNAQRQIQQLERTQLATMTNPENYTIMADRIRHEAKAYEEFDAQVMKFAESLGVFDLVEAGKWIVEQIELGLRGFEMIPTGKKNQAAQKKT